MNHDALVHQARILRNLDKRFLQANAALVQDSEIEPLGLQPLPTMWYEDEEGNKFIPDWDSANPTYPDTSVYKYAHSRFGRELHHDILEIKPDGSSSPMGGMNSTFPEDLALALVTHEGFKLSDAIALSGSCCERCLNILVHHYGLPDGYPRDSEDAQRVGTHCEVCRQVDPDYDQQVRDAGTGLPDVNITVASVFNRSDMVFRQTAHRFLRYIAQSNDEVQRVAYMEPDSFCRMLCKHSNVAEMADLTKDESDKFYKYAKDLHKLLVGEPSAKKASAFLMKMGKCEETAGVNDTNDFIRYLTVSALGKEQPDFDYLKGLREGTNSFIERFRYRKNSNLEDLASQTLFKFEHPANILNYQQLLLKQLSHYIINQSAENKHLAIANLKYLGDTQLASLIAY